MSLTATVLFGTPQAEIAGMLNDRIENAKRIKIVSGFATVEGIKALEHTLRSKHNALDVLVVGAATYRAFEALDELISYGVPGENLFVHLGHTRLTKPGAINPFYKYHPMLHSKIYYFELDDNKACAFIGSHNVTGFALKGLNGEAAIMIEGDVNNPEFEKIRNHIDASKSEAVAYYSDMKQAYSWWTNQFFEGLQQKTNDIPRDKDAVKTILVFCQKDASYPSKNDIIYFELPAALGKIQSLKADVHVFVFDVLPATPDDCLMQLNSSKSYWCSVEGVENNKGGKELAANYFVDSQARPELKTAANPFRPRPMADKQQIRVRVINPVYGQFKYLFGKQNLAWLPEFNEQRRLRYDESFAEKVQSLKLIPPENYEWSLVTGLVPADGYDDSPYQKTLLSMQPESGAFILFSTSREKKQKAIE